MAQISARTATLAKWAVIPVALLVSGAAVSQASYSAFSATSENAGNNWAAGTVKLANNASPSTAIFTASTLKPGDYATKCITVTSSGSVASAVKLYTTAATTTNALSSSIDLVITQGTGGDAACTGFTALSTGSGVYTGTLAALGSSATNFATGVGAWTPASASSAAPETRTYKITYTLNPNTPNTAQGGTASVGFTWEAQNS